MHNNNNNNNNSSSPQYNEKLKEKIRSQAFRLTKLEKEKNSLLQILNSKNNNTINSELTSLNTSSSISSKKNCCSKKLKKSYSKKDIFIKELDLFKLQISERINKANEDILITRKSLDKYELEKNLLLNKIKNLNLDKVLNSKNFFEILEKKENKINE